MNKILFWTLAVVLTLSAAVYQRLTGPTYPKRISIKIDNVEIKGKLVRSNNTGENATVVLKNVPEELSATPVSYTHLDVYKRQPPKYARLPGAARRQPRRSRS